MVLQLSPCDLLLVAKKILIHSIFLEGLGFQVRYGMIGDVDRTMRSGKCLSVDKA